MKWFIIFCLLIIPAFIFSDDLSDFANTSSQPAPSQNTSTTRSLRSLQTRVDQLTTTVNKALARPDSQAVVANEKDWQVWEEQFKDKYERHTIWAFRGMITWTIIAMALLLYGFYYFNHYAGLGKNRYKHLTQLIDEDETIPLSEKADRYPQNPHSDETFGLPRGTVRGMLSLTLLLANCLLIYWHVYAPPSSRFDKIIDPFQTAFLMMIAFYFGSKSVEVLKSREQSRRKIAEVTGAVQTTMAKIRKVLPLLDRPTTSPKIESEGKPSASVKLSKTNKPDIKDRCLSLTTYFETGKKLSQACTTVAGNFDGQGVSLGCLQWNLGQETLQPILLNYFHNEDQAWKNDVHLRQLNQILQQPLDIQLKWAKSIQEQRGHKWTLFHEWLQTFQILGKKTCKYQTSQACAPRFDRAESWCADWGLISERALALMFDISVQNGSLYKVVESRNINVKRSITERIVNAGSPDEAQKLMIIAEERAKATLPEWQKVVLARKTTIARGQGMVNGAHVNLDDFHISLERSFG